MVCIAFFKKFFSTQNEQEIGSLKILYKEKEEKKEGKRW